MATGSYDDVDAAQVRFRALWIRRVDSSLKEAVRTRGHHKCQIGVARSQDTAFRREIANDGFSAGKAGISSMRSCGVGVRLLLVTGGAHFSARVRFGRRDLGLIHGWTLDFVRHGGP